MTSAKELFESGDKWSDYTSRKILPILLELATTKCRLTYKELDQEILNRWGGSPLRQLNLYGKSLDKTGKLIQKLSEEWGNLIPSLTVLVINQETRLPGKGFDFFLEHYMHNMGLGDLTALNRLEMVGRVTQDVFDYPGWNNIAEYFDLWTVDDLSDMTRIHLPPPSPIHYGEGNDHRRLKEYIADHPELFSDIGVFDKGTVEEVLLSNDRVDVLFRNGVQALAVEVKPTTAPASELTRGIFQCVKYRAVLHAMYELENETVEVHSVLITPQQLPILHQQAAARLQVPVIRIAI